MNKRLLLLSTLASPLLAGIVAPALIHLCLILFFINPFLVLLCVGPFAGLLPPDFGTFL